MYPLSKVMQPFTRYITNASAHIDVQLRGKDADNFRQLWTDAVASGVTLSNGKTVQTKSDLIKWVAEQHLKSVRTIEKIGVDKS